MVICILMVQGLAELLGVAGFMFGYFADIWWIMIASGIVIVLDDVCDMLIGTLYPIFPIVFAIALAIIIDPWYVGIFWSLACFKLLNIPGALLKIFAPHKVKERVLKQVNERRTF